MYHIRCHKLLYVFLIPSSFKLQVPFSKDCKHGELNVLHNHNGMKAYCDCNVLEHNVSSHEIEFRVIDYIIINFEL
jgi:hypothetical protein